MDAGGKIRSANILKNLKGGAFRTCLLAPATIEEENRWRSDLGALADETAYFRAPTGGPFRGLRRAGAFLGDLPVSACAIAGAASRNAVSDALSRRPDLVLFDYVQSLASAPVTIGAPHIFFAHNVETEILDRHAATAHSVMKPVWAHEAAKMRRFERRASTQADGVITVSERDAEIFRNEFGARTALAIPTGVDADYFNFDPPADDAPPRLVFTGSMDWKANQDGVSWFMNEIWPLISAKRPDATFVVIGKNPPVWLVSQAQARGLNWRFTGFVDDVRLSAKGAAFVMPLRVGGGTRIKAFEAMAMGLPVVSTTLGVEGLNVEAGAHYLEADDPASFAAATLALLEKPPLRRDIALRARRLVETEFSHQAAARVFERNCLAILEAAR